MAHAQILEKPISGAEILSVLPTLPLGIATVIKPLIKAADIEVYKHFLVTMYHYTHDAFQQLRYAYDACEDPILKHYFEEMAIEERGHFMLAKQDYRELGGDVSKSIAPASVQAFKDYWYGLGKENVNEFVGAMYVFENVATRVGKEVVEMMQRLELTKRQSRWLRVHLEADVGHGDEAFKMCQQYVDHNPAAMLRAAEEGAAQWTAVFQHAFSNIG